ncbi:MAG: indole-3-glycerol-phosphate synthase [Actinomycetota bacterium]
MFLDDAMSRSAAQVAERRRRAPARALERLVAGPGPAPSFRRAIRRDGGPVRVIAEVKRVSPSAGPILPGASVADLVGAYEEAGAAAVSILTSDLFGGSPADIGEALGGCGLPVLRKDFISDEYQVLEARALGASAVLLIADALEEPELVRLLAAARDLGLDALVESHSREGIHKAADAGADIIGINNRDLRTLQVDVCTTEENLESVPHDTVVVSESGIRTRECVQRMESLGVDALLIGEELMRAEDPGSRLRELLGT